MALQLNSGYKIVIPSECGVSGEYAGYELAKYLEKIVGIVFPVVQDDAPVEEKEILIGKTNRFGTPNDVGLKNDGYKLRTVGEKLFIYGENDRANLYGVYYLLETYLGCGFYAYDTEVVPENPDACLPDIDIKRVSPFEFRQTRWWELKVHDDFAIKRGSNANCYGPVYSEKVGKCLRVDHLAHSAFLYVHPDEYFDEHPEYFSEVNGIRLRNATQLCLTNPEVIEIVRTKLRRNIEENPDIKIFGISQMDWYNPCQCEKCAAIDKEEDSHMGTMLRFLNALAEDIEEDYPDVVIQTLAYQYTRQAPKITRPHKNICICLCTIECCFTHPLRECDVPVVPFRNRVDFDRTMQRDLRDWGKICKRLMIWDYTTNYRFYLAPMINLHVLQDNVKFFLENGVTFLFEQGNDQSISGEFGELRAYILSKLMWEPDGDVSAWMDEFLDVYYGAGGRAVRAYIDYLTDHVTRHNVHAGIYENPMDVIPDNMLPRMTELWNEAARLTTDDPRSAEHVDRSRLQLEFVKHQRMVPGEIGFQEHGEALIAAVKRHNITYLQEIFESVMPQTQALERSFEQIRKGNLPDSAAVFWRPF